VTTNLNSRKLHFKKFCHTKTVGDRATLTTYLNSAWRNTWETQISFHVTVVVFTSETGMWRNMDIGTATVLWAGRPEFDSRLRQVFATASRHALYSIHPLRSSDPMGTACFLEAERPGPWSWARIWFSTDSKNAWNDTTGPHTSSRRGYIYGFFNDTVNNLNNTASNGRTMR
jgi:hypothetical protein